MWGFLQITYGILYEVLEHRDDAENGPCDDHKNHDDVSVYMPFSTPHFTGTNA